MNEKSTNLPTDTEDMDWERLAAMTDDDIDTSDIPPLTEDFLKRARVRMPKERITVQIDADVLKWFQAQGDDYQQRINAALRIYVEAHKAA